MDTLYLMDTTQEVSIRIEADTSNFDKAMDRIIEILGLPEEEEDSDDG